MTIHQKIKELRQSIGKVSKNADNPFYKSKYASIDYVEDLINQNLPDGLTYFYKIENETVKAGFVYSDGQKTETVESSIPLMIERVASVAVKKEKDSTIELIKIDPQKVGAAITYYKRYCLMLALGLTAEDEDDDGNSLAVNQTSASRYIGKPKHEIIRLLSASQDLAGLQTNWAVLKPDLQELSKADFAEVTAAKDEIKQLLSADLGDIK